MQDNKNNISQKTIVAMNIYDYIQASGLTQSEVAKRAGISKSTLSAYVQGVNYPRAEQMAALARVFGVSVGALTGSREDEVTELNLSVHPEIAETAATMLRLPLRDRRTVLILAQALLAAQNQPGPTDEE